MKERTTKGEKIGGGFFVHRRGKTSKRVHAAPMPFEHATLMKAINECERLGSWPKDVWVPEPSELPRGAIVVTARIIDCITSSDSPWFAGRYGFVLRDVRPVQHIPVVGALGFFKWRKA